MELNSKTDNKSESNTFLAWSKKPLEELVVVESRGDDVVLNSPNGTERKINSRSNLLHGIDSSRSISIADGSGNVAVVLSSAEVNPLENGDFEVGARSSASGHFQVFETLSEDEFMSRFTDTKPVFNELEIKSMIKERTNHKALENDVSLSM